MLNSSTNKKSYSMEKRAEFARSVEYVRSMMEDANLALRMEYIREEMEDIDPVTDKIECDTLIKHLNCDSDDCKEEEIDRLLASDSDMSLDEMIGINDDVFGSSMEAAFIEGVTSDYLDLLYVKRRKLKSAIKVAKKAIKNYDAKTAKKAIQDIKNLNKEFKNDFEKIYKGSNKMTIGQFLLGNLVVILIDCVKTIALALPGLLAIGVAPGSSAVVIAGNMNSLIAGLSVKVQEFVDFVQGISHDIKKDGISLQSFNVLHGRVVNAIALNDQMIKELEKRLDDIKDLKESSDDILSGIDNDLFTEGSNTELFKLYMAHIKKAKESIRDAKKLIKSGDYAEAKKLLKESKKEISATKDIIKNGDDTSAEKIIGAFVPFVADYITLIAGMSLSLSGASMVSKASSMSFNFYGLLKAPIANRSKQAAEITASINKLTKTGTLINGVGSIFLIVSLIQDMLKLTKITDGIKAIKKDRIEAEGNSATLKEITVGADVNAYRGYLYATCDDILIFIDRLEKDVDVREKYDKEQEKLKKDL